MKAPRPQVKKSAALSRGKARLRAHAALIYRFRRETQSTDAAVVQRTLRGPTPFLLRRVSQEAARLSALNRRPVITQREVVAALEQLRRRRSATLMAGA
ncbi:histone H2B.1, sperm-like [Astyanax mexicanus]|uniref:Histone H2B.1, sperm-like n=1 Tax=Astyanax mexicanus TaxID=7994 RepID=A0A8T2KT48_ASTMX|nr:histone H2B.1, sperm-like [Astyanax mexicanus]